MARLPTVGGDDGTWGDVLNDYLDEQHDTAGEHKSITIPNQSAAGDDSFKVKISSDTEYRFIVDADGNLQWGPGATTAPDTNLYRSAANLLKTDDAFQIDSPAAGTVPLIVRGAVSQSANLLELQNSSSTVQIAVASSGTINTPSSDIQFDTNGGRINFGQNNNYGSIRIRNLSNSTIFSILNSGDNWINSPGTTRIVLRTNATERVSVPGNNLDGFEFGSARDTNLYRSAANTLKSDDTFSAADVIGHLDTITFSKTGELATGTGTMRWYADNSYTIVEVRASVGTAPTGASVIVDVNKNGTTIFSTQGNRPTIAVSTNTDGSNVPDVTTLADGDYFSVDIDQIGSTVKGSDLTVQVLLRRA